MENRAHGFEWVALLAAAALLALLALRQLWPTDLGWQIATGRLVLHSGPPLTEQLSWLAAGRPVIEPRWLWCAALAWTVDGFGPGAVSWAVAALFLAAFAIVAAMRTPRRQPLLAAAVLIAAALTASQRFMARPDAVSALMFATFLAVLDRDRRRQDAWVFLLLPAQVLWVNSHTLFGLGIALAMLRTLVAAGASFGPRESRADPPLRALLITSALAAVCLINPYGIGIFRFAGKLVGELQSRLTEAYAYELVGPFAVRQGYLSTTWFVVLGLGAIALAIARPRRLDPLLAVVWLFTLGLALSAIRNLLWFALATVPFVLHLGERDGRGAGWPRALRVSVAIAVAGLALFESWRVTTDRFFVDQNDTGRFGVGLTPHRYPEAVARATVRWMATARGGVAVDEAIGAVDPAAPRVYATPHEASWLLQAGVPSAIDPRLENFSPAEFHADLVMQNDSAMTRIHMDRLGVEAIVCGLESTHWLSVLAREPGWRLEFMDEIAALFVRTAEPESPADALRRADSLVEGVRAALPGPASSDRNSPWESVASAAPHHRVGNALLLLGRPDRAREFLEGAVAIAPRSIPARLSLASALEATSDRRSARAQRELAVGYSPKNAEALSALALQQLEDHEVAEARALLERSVRHHPSHARSWALLGESRAMGGDMGGAVSALERAVQLEPASAQYRRRLESMRSGRPGREPGP